jgi:hypothetical protein
MRGLTQAEQEAVEVLIREAEDTIADLTNILGPDEQAVRDVRAARDWLRGIRDTGIIVGAHS